MSFLQFFIYMTISNLIYHGCLLGYMYGRVKYRQYRFNKLVKEGKIKIVTMDDLAAQIQAEGEKKTWN